MVVIIYKCFYASKIISYDTKWNKRNHILLLLFLICLLIIVNNFVSIMIDYWLIMRYIDWGKQFVFERWQKIKKTNTNVGCGVEVRLSSLEAAPEGEETLMLSCANEPGFDKLVWVWSSRIVAVSGFCSFSTRFRSRLLLFESLLPPPRVVCCSTIGDISVGFVLAVAFIDCGLCACERWAVRNVRLYFSARIFFFISSMIFNLVCVLYLLF